MVRFVGFVVLVTLFGCDTQSHEVQIEIPEGMPVIERFQEALEIVGAMSADGFPKLLKEAGTTVYPDDITSSDLTLAAVAEVSDAVLAPRSERVYIVCTIHNQKKADEIEDECRRRISEHLER